MVFTHIFENKMFTKSSKLLVGETCFVHFVSHGKIATLGFAVGVKRFPQRFNVIHTITLLILSNEVMSLFGWGDHLSLRLLVHG